MKKNKILFMVSILFILIFPAFMIANNTPQKGQQIDLKELYKYLNEWLDSPIKHVITKVEEKAYKLKLKLKKREEQLQYIEFFWRRRDPTPGTEINEFQEEFLKRVAQADKFYQIGKKPGWDSQRGQVFIVYGPPNELNKGPRTETWLYYSLPGTKMPQNFSILFFDQRGNNDYRVSQTDYPGKSAGESYMDAQTDRIFSRTLPREITEGIEEINELAITSRSLSLNDVPLPPQHLFEANKPKSQIPPPPPPQTTPVTEVPFDVQQLFFKAEEFKVEMMVHFSLPYKNISFQDEEGKKVSELKVQAALIDSNKKKIDEFSETFSFSLDPQELEAKQMDHFGFWKSLKVAPGQYSLNLVSEDKTSGEKREMKGDISIPMMEGQGLMVSTIVPAAAIIPSEKTTEERAETKTFHFSGFDITPNLNAIYTTDDNLCIFFQVLNLQLDKNSGQPNTEINCYIFKGEKIFKPLRLSEENFASRKPGEIIAHLCVALTDFPLSEYDVIIQVKDKLAGTDTARKLKVTVGD